MAVDRDRLEQEAMRLLQRGQTDRALERYLALLKGNPRDRRIRQRVAELYAKVGRLVEAERHFREIVRQLRAAGQSKAAIGVYKQLVRLRPDDPELIAEMGDCWADSGFPSEAAGCWEQAVDMLAGVHPADAVPHLRKLIRARPGDTPLRVRLAELLEAARWTEAAFQEWSGLAAEARRLGRTEDELRFLEQALRLRADHPEALRAAADAALRLGDGRRALEHLQRAAAGGTPGADLLELLARAFEAVGQPERARGLWVECARLHGEAGEVEARARALQAAVDAGETDPAVVREAAEAARRAEAERLRLDEQDWARPREPEVVRLVVRARVLRRYGFPERARAVLDAAPPELAERLPVRVARVEVLAELGETAAALRELEGVLAPSSGAARDVATRLEVLRAALARSGGEEAAAEGEDDGLLDDELLDDELLDDDELLADGVLAEDGGPAAGEAAAGEGGSGGEDEPTDDEPTAAGDGDLDELEARGDALAAAGDREGAIEAWQAVLARDPGRDRVLVKLGDLLASAPSLDAPAAPPPEPGFGGEDPFADFGLEVAPEPAAPARPAPGRPAPSAGGDGDAWAWLAVGRPDEAEAAAGDDLDGALVRALARKLRGDLPGAARLLRLAVADAAEDDPAYRAAILELAGLSAATGKLAAARRLLDELEDLDPGFDPVGVRRVRRGLALLAGER